MDQVDFTTNAPRRKGSHLTLEERVIIQTRRREKKSLRAIVREIHCSPSTVANELKRGQVLLYNGKISYRAGVGQDTYVAHRSAVAGVRMHWQRRRSYSRSWRKTAAFAFISRIRSVPTRKGRTRIITDSSAAFSRRASGWKTTRFNTSSV
mgnify:CR=1 FL=1